MKWLLVLLFVIVSLNAVRIQNKEEQKIKDNSFQLIVGKCTSDQSVVVNDAINQCENQDLRTTATCINNYIKANTKGSQEWNSVIFSNNQTQPGIQFWYFNDCFVKILKNQTFNRTYILWPDKLFLNSTQISHPSGILKSQQQKAKNKYQNDLSDQNLKADNCSTWRKNIVNATMQYCDVKSNNIAAQCIANRLRSLVSDYWNVVVSSSKSTFVYPWFYRSCDISVTNYGQFERNIQVWKAYYD